MGDTSVIYSNSTTQPRGKIKHCKNYNAQLTGAPDGQAIRHTVAKKLLNSMDCERELEQLRERQKKLKEEMEMISEMKMTKEEKSKIVEEMEEAKKKERDLLDTVTKVGRFFWTAVEGTAGKPKKMEKVYKTDLEEQMKEMDMAGQNQGGTGKKQNGREDGRPAGRDRQSKERKPCLEETKITNLE